MRCSSDQVEAVYDWESRFTAESRHQLLASVDYYWPREIDELRIRLLKSKRQLMAVLGCQGIGKTSAMYALDMTLDNNFYSSLLAPAKDKKGDHNVSRQVISLNLTDLKNHDKVDKSTSLRFWGLLNPYTEELNRMLQLRKIRNISGKISLRDAAILFGEEKC